MIYRNKKNGAVIDIPSKLISPDWEDISGSADKEGKADESSVRKRKRHNSAGNKSDSSAAAGDGDTA